MKEVFDRLRSIQFDPIAPVGCNHDLVLQARLKGYRIGDWERLAYKDRLIYDGWDKQASLVPFEGWPLRRFYYTVHRRAFEKKIFEDHKEAVDRILAEIAERGPLLPRECEFQLRNDDWKDAWFGPNVTKQTLRALWHSGLVMTAGRKNGQHLYDLTERVVPDEFLRQPMLPQVDAIRQLVLERHRAMGIVRPAAPYEVWSFQALSFGRKEAIAELVRRGEILAVDVEGVAAHATPEFLSLLDQPSLEPEVTFVAPLDQLMWDRKMITHFFGFDYIWEIYKPETNRRWGYYVLPIRYGDNLVARAEFSCRKGVLEMREWHYEAARPGKGFWPELRKSVRKLMHYCAATETVVRDHVDPKVREVVLSMGR